MPFHHYGVLHHRYGALHHHYAVLHLRCTSCEQERSVFFTKGPGRSAEEVEEIVMKKTYGMPPLRAHGAWLASKARKTDTVVHVGRLLGIMVEKAAEVPGGDPRRKFKYRVVFQGNSVVT